MKTILVVEDNISYQNLLKKRLTQDDFSVLTAGDGKQAEEMVKTKHVDLILLDLLMPGVDGISFYNKLKNILKKHIPIIVLTNVTDATGYGEDIKDVLIKANVSIDDVATKVHEYLK